MSTELKLRRGNSAQHESFTGANGEVTFNTDTKELHGHDGITPGGFPLVRKDALAATDSTVLVGGIEAGEIAKRQLTPKHFGAVGDGVADDTTALQAWIDGSENYLFLADGNYRFTGIIVIPSNKKIIGFPNGKLIADNTSGNTIRVSGDNVTFDHVIIEGQSPGGVAVGINGLVRNTVFRFCEFSNLGQMVWIFTAENVKVLNSNFTGNTYGVIQQEGFVSDNVLIDGNVFTNMRGDAIEANCETSAPSKNWTAVNNIYKGAFDYPTLDRERRFWGSTRLDNVVIANNIIENSTGDAPIHCENTAGEYIITGNVIKNCVTGFGQSGYIYLLTGFKKAVVANNIFLHTDPSLPFACALDMGSGSVPDCELIFTGNHIEGNSSAESGNFGGVDFRNNGSNKMLLGNTFKNVAWATRSFNTSNVIFDGNLVDEAYEVNNYAAGATSSTGVNWYVRNNTFKNIGLRDYTFVPNSNGTGCGQNFVFTGNRFDKALQITGLNGGAVGGASDMRDVTIKDNIFGPSAVLTTENTMSRLVRDGNVFQSSGFLETILPNYINDSAAAAGGVPVGGMYRNGSIVQVRVA